MRRHAEIAAAAGDLSISQVRTLIVFDTQTHTRMHTLTHTPSHSHTHTLILTQRRPEDVRSAVIESTAGMGKTMLLSSAVLRAVELRVGVLVATCNDLEVGNPYYALRR
jgi:hypothetical protein